MKQLYRCEYCDKIGIAEEIAKHEQTCVKNHNNKSCLTCKHKEREGIFNLKCNLDIPIKEGCMIENCSSYENNGQVYTTTNPIASNTLFGGVFFN